MPRTFREAVADEVRSIGDHLVAEWITDDLVRLTLDGALVGDFDEARFRALSSLIGEGVCIGMGGAYGDG